MTFLKNYLKTATLVFFTSEASTLFMKAWNYDANYNFVLQFHGESGSSLIYLCFWVTWLNIEILWELFFYLWFSWFQWKHRLQLNYFNFHVFNNHIFWDRKQPRRCSLKEDVLKSFAILTGKQFCWSLFLIKLQISGFHRCLSANIAKFSSTPVLSNFLTASGDFKVFNNTTKLILVTATALRN